MSLKLLLTINLKDKYLDMIKGVSSDLDIVKALDIKKQQQEIIDADIMISGGADSAELLARAEQMDWIQTWSAGIDRYTETKIIEIVKEKNIRVANMSGIHGEPIAEHVMGLMINYSRRLYKFYEQQQQRKWKRLEVGQLAGKTVVIVGTGSIGKEIARKAQVFKMKTIGVKRTVKGKVDFIDQLYSNLELITVLQKADFIVVTVPLTTETEGMFGRKEFAAMKETAFFINIARGLVVDQEALIAALQQGTIAGAGLDVFQEEPLPVDSPLYTLENVYITPHVSGFHPDYNIKATKLFIDNLKRYLAGKELLNLVDFGRGY